MLNNLKNIAAITGLILLIFFGDLRSQENGGGDALEAKDNFVYGDWYGALKEYQSLIKTDTINPIFNYRLGICYLQTYTNRKKSIEYLSKALALNCGEKDAPFMLGKAYHVNYEFEKAIAQYREAITTTNDKDLIERAELYIEMCQNAQQIIKQPLLNVKFKNLGEEINSNAPDYFAFIDEDENFLFFNSKRQKGNQGYLSWNGFYSIDVFTSRVKRGHWTKARSIGGAVGTSEDDEVVGLSLDGGNIFIDYTNFKNQGDIYISELSGKAYLNPVLLGEPISQSDIERSAFISKDGNVLYFASNRGGGVGGFDLYTSKKLPDGNWGTPELIPELNTQWDELFPTLSSNGKHFYFASEGHNSMGGFDVFKSDWDSIQNKWGAPKNIGYPLNTPDDNYQISYTKEGKRAYLSQYRPDGIGDLDIYEVEFTNIEQKITAVTGQIQFLREVDYNDYQDFVLYQKGEKKKRYTKTFPPLESGWKKVEDQRVEVKKGYEYRVYVEYKEASGIQKYLSSKIPDELKSKPYHDVKIQLTPINDFKDFHYSCPTQIEEAITDVKIRVYPIGEKTLLGEYQPSKSNGKYVIILPEGEYNVEVNAPGFKLYEDTIKIEGKGSYRQIVNRNILLEPNAPKKAIHYSEIDQNLIKRNP